MFSILKEPDVRQRLRGDLSWMLGLLGLASAAWLVSLAGFGWDSHAYWLAANALTYASAPGQPNAYLYSPAFAQMIAPLARLGWPLFALVISSVSALLAAWMLKPLGWRRALPFWLACAPEIASGNIFLWLAAVSVVGLRYPGAWGFAAFTKVTPFVGPLWFAARQEWWQLAKALLWTAVLGAVSYVSWPAAWDAWFGFLGENLHSVRGTVGSPLFPGPAVRLPLALLTVVWGARTDRRWALPVSMLLATPVFGLSAVALCAAIPRLRLYASNDHEPSE